MKNTFLLKSFVSANIDRSAGRKRSLTSEGFLMGGCTTAAFLFVGLFVLGVF